MLPDAFLGDCGFSEFSIGIACLYHELLSLNFQLGLLPLKNSLSDRKELDLEVAQERPGAAHDASTASLFKW